jgi:hypothetical protein
LLKEVAGQAAEKAGNLVFQGVDLPALVERVLKGDHLDGKLRLRALEFDVLGDEKVKRLIFRGSDTLYSKTYGRTVNALKGIKLAPRACTMTYDDGAGIRISLEADLYGNFGFRVSREAENLSWLRIILDYLVANDLLLAKRILPTRRLERSPEAGE